MSPCIVAVFGIGGLGHLAVQYVAIAGATVVAVDLSEVKLNLAKELGATYAIDGAAAGPDRSLSQARGIPVSTRGGSTRSTRHDGSH
jgi:alcohol dehydrogenase, propanol-preferring